MGEEPLGGLYRGTLMREKPSGLLPAFCVVDVEQTIRAPPSFLFFESSYGLGWVPPHGKSWVPPHVKSWVPPHGQPPHGQPTHD